MRTPARLFTLLATTYVVTTGIQATFGQQQSNAPPYTNWCGLYTFNCARKDHDRTCSALQNSSASLVPVLHQLQDSGVISINCPGQASKPAAAAAPPSKCVTNTQLLILVVPAVVCGMLALFGLAWWLMHPRQRPVHLLAPGAGPATTLLVTDVQDSTTLWESLPMDVMDEVLEMHHDCMRAAAVRCGGYESATEGDSFILAFHSALDAFTFALDCQARLQAMQWPEQLLAHPKCRPLYAQLVGRDPTKFDQQLESQPASPTARLLEMSVLDKTFGRGAEASAASDAIGAGLKRRPKTFLQLCKDVWCLSPQATDKPDESLVYRGIRVRIGLHSGVQEGDISVNRVDDQRTHYQGSSLALARLVSECGQGGVISLSQAAYTQLPMDSMWRGVLVIHNGMHELDQRLQHVQVYQALPRTLSGRLGNAQPVGSLLCLESGAFDAPMAYAAICYLKVAEAEVIQQWNPDVARASMETFHKAATSEMRLQCGYSIEIKGGLMLASFHNAAHALLWALNTMQRCTEELWPAELLASQFGEACLREDGVWLRGPRLKAGVEVGEVIGALHPISGKITYKGRAMNRAARILSVSNVGQVLCSMDAWNNARQSELARYLHERVDRTVKLKGIEHTITLLSIRTQEEHTEPVADRASGATSQTGPPHLLSHRSINLFKSFDLNWLPPRVSSAQLEHEALHHDPTKSLLLKEHSARSSAVFWANSTGGLSELELAAAGAVGTAAACAPVGLHGRGLMRHASTAMMHSSMAVAAEEWDEGGEEEEGEEGREEGGGEEGREEGGEEQGQDGAREGGAGSGGVQAQHRGLPPGDVVLHTGWEGQRGGPSAGRVGSATLHHKPSRRWR